MGLIQIALSSYLSKWLGDSRVTLVNFDSVCTQLLEARMQSPITGVDLLIQWIGLYG